MEEIIDILTRIERKIAINTGVDIIYAYDIIKNIFRDMEKDLKNNNLHIDNSINTSYFLNIAKQLEKAYNRVKEE